MDSKNVSPYLQLDIFVLVNMVNFLNNSAMYIPTFCGLEYVSNDLDDGVALLDNGKYAIFFGVDSVSIILKYID